MSTLKTIAILLIIVGVLLSATGVLGRRRAATETLSSGDQTPSNLKLHTKPAVNIDQGASRAGAGAAAKAVAAGGGGGAGVAKRVPRHDEHGRLVFIQESRVRFEIEDLLRASTEVLGSGSFGSSYKATLCDGSSVVVKRFKDMNGVGQEDFSEHMR